MSLNNCSCDTNIKNYGVFDPQRVQINGADRTALNWTEISVPEILTVPTQKPDMENIDKVYVNTDITSVSLIETPFAYESFEIIATADQIAAMTALNTALTALNTAVTGLLTPLNAIITAAATPLNPCIISLQKLIDQLTIANATFLTNITALTTALGIADVTVNALCIALTAVTNSIILIQSILNSLICLLNKMLTDCGFDATIVAAITTAVNAAIIAVNLVLASIVTLLEDIADASGACDKCLLIRLKDNAEGTCLSGRKLIIEGNLNQKIVYTADLDVQSVHTAHFSIPFSAYIIPYARFESGEYADKVSVLANGLPTDLAGFIIGCTEELSPDICEEFCIEAYVEDIFALALDPRTIFKNITLFLYARPSKQCL